VEKSVLDVSTEERAQLCATWSDDMGRTFPGDSLQEGACTMLGLAGSTTKVECKKVHDACMEEKFPVSPEALQKACTSQWGWSRCEASVELVSTCVQGRMVATRQMYAGLDCATSGNPMLAGRVEQFQDPVECAALRDRCPDFFVGK
jgi:hypothetical protein